LHPDWSESSDAPKEPPTAMKISTRNYVGLAIVFFPLAII
jgi:hypothetical protein